MSPAYLAADAGDAVLEHQRRANERLAALQQLHDAEARHLQETTERLTRELAEARAKLDIAERRLKDDTRRYTKREFESALRVEVDTVAKPLEKEVEKLRHELGLSKREASLLAAKAADYATLAETVRYPAQRAKVAACLVMRMVMRNWRKMRLVRAWGVWWERTLKEHMRENVDEELDDMTRAAIDDREDMERQVHEAHKEARHAEEYLAAREFEIDELRDLVSERTEEADHLKSQLATRTASLQARIDHLESEVAEVQVRHEDRDGRLETLTRAHQLLTLDNEELSDTVRHLRSAIKSYADEMAIDMADIVRRGVSSGGASGVLVGVSSRGSPGGSGGNGADVASGRRDGGLDGGTAADGGRRGRPPPPLDGLRTPFARSLAAASGRDAGEVVVRSDDGGTYVVPPMPEPRQRDVESYEVAQDAPADGAEWKRGTAPPPAARNLRLHGMPVPSPMRTGGGTSPPPLEDKYGASSSERLRHGDGVDGGSAGSRKGGHGHDRHRGGSHRSKSGSGRHGHRHDHSDRSNHGHGHAHGRSRNKTPRHRSSGGGGDTGHGSRRTSPDDKSVKSGRSHRSHKSHRSRKGHSHRSKSRSRHRSRSGSRGRDRDRHREADSSSPPAWLRETVGL